jgi:tripartite-type tricarboxylate transporter receptor subunit TctC
MKETPDFYRIASGFYQSKDLPDNYLELEDDEFHKLLEEGAWEPFEYWSGEDIHEEIQSLSYRMEKIARETRKNTLDEVREALNIQ